jgi:hypothetical protein
VFLTAACDDWFDPAGPQQSAVLVMVIATIGENEVGFLAWPARLASNRPGREPVQQRDQLGDIVAMPAGQGDSQWDA